MRNTMLLGLIFGLLSSTAANAQFACGVGGGIGMMVTDTATSVTYTDTGVGSRSTGPDLGVRLACDARVPGTPIVVGAFGEWDTVSLRTNQNEIAITSADAYAVGVRSGVVVGPAMPFVEVAYISTTSLSWTSNAVTVAQYLPGRLSGMMYGGGVELAPFPKMMPWLTTSLDVRLLDFDNYSVAVPGGRAGGQVDALQGMWRINVNLGSLFGDGDPSSAPRGRF